MSVLAMDFGFNDGVRSWFVADDAGLRRRADSFLKNYRAICLAHGHEFQRFVMS